MTIKIYDVNGNKISESRNMRGVIDRARKIQVSRIRIRRYEGRSDCRVSIVWLDGSHSSFDAGSYSLMVNKFSVWKNFKNATMNFNG